MDKQMSAVHQVDQEIVRRNRNHQTWRQNKALGHRREYDGHRKDRWEMKHLLSLQMELMQP